MQTLVFILIPSPYPFCKLLLLEDLKDSQSSYFRNKNKEEGRENSVKTAEQQQRSSSCLKSYNFFSSSSSLQFLAAASSLVTQEKRNSAFSHTALLPYSMTRELNSYSPFHPHLYIYIHGLSLSVYI